MSLHVKKIPQWLCKFIILFVAVHAGHPLAKDTAVADPSIRPNIVFILVDDLGMGDVGVYGGTTTPTPNIDQLAAEGLRFEQYYSVSPICSASRVGYTTGMYPARWRINSFLHTRIHNRKTEQADYLSPDAPSLARILKSSGYATGHFGKWHMGGGRDVHDAPRLAAYGFDESVSTWESPEPHPDITAGNWIWSPQDKIKRWERTGFFVDKALDFMSRHKDQPMYVQLWPDDPHTPWVPDASVTDPRNQLEKHLHLVLANLDKEIGRLMAGLKVLGVDNNTLVIFSSDNGASPTFKGRRSAGFQGSKWSLYEGGVRMPFIVRWPGTIPENTVDEQSVVSAIDFLPSVASIAQATMKTDQSLDGLDMSAALLGKAIRKRHRIFWEYGRNEDAYKFPESPERSPTMALREGDWKLLMNPDGSAIELYNLAVDPHEAKNLAQVNSDRVKKMQATLFAWRKSLPRITPEKE